MLLCARDILAVYPSVRNISACYQNCSHHQRARYLWIPEWKIFTSTPRAPLLPLAVENKKSQSRHFSSFVDSSHCDKKNVLKNKTLTTRNIGKIDGTWCHFKLESLLAVINSNSVGGRGRYCGGICEAWQSTTGWVMNKERRCMCLESLKFVLRRRISKLILKSDWKIVGMPIKSIEFFSEKIFYYYLWSLTLHHVVLKSAKCLTCRETRFRRECEGKIFSANWNFRFNFYCKYKFRRTESGFVHDVTIYRIVYASAEHANAVLMTLRNYY